MKDIIYLKYYIGFKRGDTVTIGRKKYTVVKVYRRTFWRAFFQGLGFDVKTSGIKIKL